MITLEIDNENARDLELAYFFALYMFYYLPRVLSITTPNMVTIFGAFIEFSEKHDIFAMARFYKWCKENEMEEGQILSTLLHDVNDRNSDGFVPRTESY